MKTHYVIIILVILSIKGCYGYQGMSRGADVMRSWTRVADNRIDCMNKVWSKGYYVIDNINIYI